MNAKKIVAAVGLKPRRGNANKLERLEMLTWRQIWRDLAGDSGLAWQTILIFAPIGCIAAGVYDHNRLGGGDEEWTTTTIAGYLVALVAMLLLKAYSRVNRVRRSLTMFAGFILIGISRGFIVYQVGVSFGLIPTTELLFRILGSSFLFVWVLVGGSVVVTAATKNRNATAELNTELAYLAGAKTALSKNINVVRHQLESRINDVLVPATEDLIANLKSKSKDSAFDAVTGLQNLIEKVVRPLSHRVSQPSFVIEQPTDQAAKSNNFFEVLRGNVALGDVILPTFVATATVLTALPSAIITMQLEVTLAVVVIGWAAVYAFLFLARVVLKDLFVPIWFGSILAIALPLLSGSGVIIGRWGSFMNIPEAARYEFFMLAACLSFSAFWFQVLELKRAQSLRALSAVAEEQRLLVSAMRQEIWVLQRHLASTLHGPVQAALFASLIKFGQSDKVDQEQVTELIGNLKRAMSQLADDPGFDSREFSEVWLELCEFWQGVCEVGADFDEQIITAVAESPHALRCLLDVIRESLNNAVKHAAADKVQVSLSIQSALLLVEVKNNGKPMLLNRVEGLGSELIREITHTCELVALDGADGFVTALRASIVLTVKA